VKIAQSQLKQIIKEEIAHALAENHEELDPATHLLSKWAYDVYELGETSELVDEVVALLRHYEAFRNGMERASEDATHHQNMDLDEVEKK